MQQNIIAKRPNTTSTPSGTIMKPPSTTKKAIMKKPPIKRTALMFTLFTPNITRAKPPKLTWKPTVRNRNHLYQARGFRCRGPFQRLCAM